MLARDRRSRHESVLWTESLESRRLMAATPISVMSGLPLPGLATGIGLAAPAPATVTVTVAPSSVATPMAVSATGPSTTLSPLATDSETAIAPSSEVARPTPGRSDRITSYIEPTDVVPIQHHFSPDPIEVIPGPEIQVLPPAPAQAPAIPAQPPAEPAPAAVPKAPEAAKEPMTFEAWDSTIDLIVTDFPEQMSASPAQHSGSAMAAGALLAVWGGWKFGSRFEGRSRTRPRTIRFLEAGPGR